MTSITVWMLTALGIALPVLPMSTQELTGKELCLRLTADEVTTVTGSARAATAADDRCSYTRASAPAIHLRSSPSETREAFVERVMQMKGDIQNGPGDAVVSAVAFDKQNGKMSAAWFTLNGKPVELEFDGGLELDKARALVDAARK